MATHIHHYLLTSPFLFSLTTSLSHTLASYEMASPKTYPSLLLLFLLLSLLFLSLNVSSTHLPCTPPSPRKPSPKPSPKPQKGSCPRDTVKLGACSDLLGGLLDLTIGQPPKEPCCSLLEGLTDAEAAACLCTAVKAKVLGINANALVDLSLLLNYCGKNLPSGFLCA